MRNLKDWTKIGLSSLWWSHSFYSNWLKDGQEDVRVLKDYTKECWAEGDEQRKTVFALSSLLSPRDSVLWGYNAGSCSSHLVAMRRHCCHTEDFGEILGLSWDPYFGTFCSVTINVLWVKSPAARSIPNLHNSYRRIFSLAPHFPSSLKQSKSYALIRPG